MFQLAIIYYIIICVYVCVGECGCGYGFVCVIVCVCVGVGVGVDVGVGMGLCVCGCVGDNSPPGKYDIDFFKTADVVISFMIMMSIECSQRVFES